MLTRKTGWLLMAVAVLATSIEAVEPTEEELRAKLTPLTPKPVFEIGEEPVEMLTPPDDSSISVNKFVAVVRGTTWHWTVPATFLRATPREVLESEEIRSFFKTQADRLIRRRVLRTPSRLEREAGEEVVHEFCILAPTPECAKERAMALLLLYNYGYTKGQREEVFERIVGCLDA